MSTQISTKSLHSGHDVTTNGGTRAVPIYQSTAYVFNDSDHAANLFALAETGNIYTRINNPTNDILEQRIADIEGDCRSCYCFWNISFSYNIFNFVKGRRSFSCV